MCRDYSLVLENDGQLINLVLQEMRFTTVLGLIENKVQQCALIQYFLECYDNTNQDTVLFAPEFKIVVDRILNGQRPTKLYYLTDFEGEEK